MEKTWTVFGDSIAKGIISKDGKIEMVEHSVIDILSERFNVKINNVSFYGQTLTRLIEKNLVDKYISSLDNSKKNIAIFEIGGNDSDYVWQTVAKEPFKNHLSKTPEDDFEKELIYITKKLQENNVEVWFVSLPPVNSQKYFDNVISKIVDGNEILKFFNGDISNIQRHQELYNSIVYRVANLMNCKFLDIRSSFLRNRDYLKLFCDDGIHPNQLGHKKIADEISKIINKFYKTKLCY